MACSRLIVRLRAKIFKLSLTRARWAPISKFNQAPVIMVGIKTREFELLLFAQQCCSREGERGDLWWSRSATVQQRTFARVRRESRYACHCCKSQSAPGAHQRARFNARVMFVNVAQATLQLNFSGSQARIWRYSKIGRQIMRILHGFRALSSRARARKEPETFAHTYTRRIVH